MKDVHRGAPPVDASLNQRRESPSIADGVFCDGRSDDDCDDSRDDVRGGRCDE